jgi:hypothetical protein
MALAQFAPSLIKIFTGRKKAADVAGKVVDIAKAVTGADTGEAALEANKADPNKLRNSGRRSHPNRSSLSAPIWPTRKAPARATSSWPRPGSTTTAPTYLPARR